jgi:hypothetical protein
VKLLKRQAADIGTMLSAMGQQLSQMTAAYREELENVERALLQVRLFRHSTAVNQQSNSIVQQYQQPTNFPELPCPAMPPAGRAARHVLGHAMECTCRTCRIAAVCGALDNLHNTSCMQQHTEQ